MLCLDKGSKTVIYYLPQQCFAHPSLAPLPRTYEWMTELSPGSQFLCSCPRTVGTSILPSLELLCLFSSHSPSGSFAPYVAFCATPFMFYSFFTINNKVTQLFIFKIILFAFFFFLCLTTELKMSYCIYFDTYFVTSFTLIFLGFPSHWMGFSRGCISGLSHPKFSEYWGVNKVWYHIWGYYKRFQQGKEKLNFKRKFSKGKCV